MKNCRNTVRTVFHNDSLHLSLPPDHFIQTFHSPHFQRTYLSDSMLCLFIDSGKIISFTFGIGSALAAAAGVLVGVYYNSIDPLMGIMPGLKAFVAAVLGGIGILPGAMLGGIILGVVEALVSGFISSTFRDAAAFAILILILLFKPSGLLGKNTREKV